MKKYFQYLFVSAKVALAYKWNFLFSAFFDLAFFLIFFSLWTNVYRVNNLTYVGSYDINHLITYYFITEVIFRLDVMGSMYLNYQIWDGYFTNDLIKPWNVTVVNMLDTIAEKAINVLMCIPAVLLMIFIARRYIEFTGFNNILLFLASVAVAFLLNISFNLSLHALCFKYGDQDAMIGLGNYVSWFLAGAFFPLEFLPAKFHAMVNLLPFKYLFDVPANTYLGKFSPDQILMNFAVGLLWIVILLSTYLIIFKRGVKYYTGTGR